MKTSKENQENYGYNSALEEMKAILDAGYDPEVQHSHADAILCKLLLFWGFDELVDLYAQVPKWYA